MRPNDGCATRLIEINRSLTSEKSEDGYSSRTGDEERH